MYCIYRFLLRGDHFWFTSLGVHDYVNYIIFLPPIKEKFAEFYITIYDVEQKQ